MFIALFKGKGKAISVQAWTGPSGCRRVRFPDCCELLYLTTQFQTIRLYGTMIVTRGLLSQAAMGYFKVTPQNLLRTNDGYKM
jgi:hypothetical protein